MDMDIDINMENNIRQIIADYPLVEERFDIWYQDEVAIEPMEVLATFPVCPN